MHRYELILVKKRVHIIQKKLKYLFNYCTWTAAEFKPQMTLHLTCWITSAFLLVNIWHSCKATVGIMSKNIYNSVCSVVSAMEFCFTLLANLTINCISPLQTWVQTVWAAPWALCPAVSLLLLRTTLMCSLRPELERRLNHARCKDA